jgi:hypothetical protein
MVKGVVIGGIAMVVLAAGGVTGYHHTAKRLRAAPPRAALETTYGIGTQKRVKSLRIRAIKVGYRIQDLFGIA